MYIDKSNTHCTARYNQASLNDFKVAGGFFFVEAFEQLKQLFNNQLDFEDFRNRLILEIIPTHDELDPRVKVERRLTFKLMSGTKLRPVKSMSPPFEPEQIEKARVDYQRLIMAMYADEPSLGLDLLDESGVKFRRVFGRFYQLIYQGEVPNVRSIERSLSTLNLLYRHFDREDYPLTEPFHIDDCFFRPEGENLVPYYGYSGLGIKPISIEGKIFAIALGDTQFQWAAEQRDEGESIDYSITCVEF